MHGYGNRLTCKKPQPGGRLLVNTGNNSAAPSETLFLDAPIDEETGEILPKWDPTRKWVLQQAHKKLNPTRRYLSCFSTIRGDRQEVEVRQSADSGRCYLAGLMTCGSVWACPVCAAKIQQVRSIELRQAILAAEEEGLTVAMLAPTVPHTLQDDLGDLLDDYTRALSAVLNGRAFRKLREQYGIEGYIRALEVTFGFSNGWHPHAHVLFFLEEGADLVALEGAMFPLWEKAVAGRGLGQVSRKPFKLQSATQAHAYVTKLGREWGPAEELVRSHTKRARGERFSPFDLLGQYAYGDQEEPDTARFGALYKHYAEVFHGRRQLQWSRGLKVRLLGEEGRTDQEIADSIGKVDVILSRISAEDWRLILRANMRGAVVYAADLHGAEGVENLLEGLRTRYGIEKGREDSDGGMYQAVLHDEGSTVSGRQGATRRVEHPAVQQVQEGVLRAADRGIPGSPGRSRGDAGVPEWNRGPQ